MEKQTIHTIKLANYYSEKLFEAHLATRRKTTEKAYFMLKRRKKMNKVRMQKKDKDL